jgi:4-hydroxy-tetrahydrodipicolinate synthase
MKHEHFAGCMTALVTPFGPDGVDYAALRRLVAEQIEAGIDGLVPCGSTGEAATLNDEERRGIVRAVVEAASGAVPVIAGTGTNCTDSSIKRSLEAREDGVDAVMLVAPYYNKPTQDGMIQHFSAVAQAVDLPVILYNVPGRTASSIAPATVLKLAEIDNIVGIKEASGSINNSMHILSVRPDFTVLSGEDGLFLPLLAVGAHGLISVTSNVMPARMAAIYDAWIEGRRDDAKDLFHKMWPVIDAMFFETNPIPAKAALGLLGKIDPAMRLPLTPMTGANLARLEAVLRQAGFLSGN